MITLIAHRPGTTVFPPVADEAHINSFLNGVEGMAEANRCEQGYLWEELSSRASWSWKENNLGLLHTVGYIGDLPVVLSMTTAVIKGKKVLFYYPTSRVVDHEMIEAFLDEHLPDVPNTDSTNFTNLFHN